MKKLSKFSFSFLEKRKKKEKEKQRVLQEYRKEAMRMNLMEGIMNNTIRN